MAVQLFAIIRTSRITVYKSVTLFSPGIKAKELLKVLLKCGAYQRKKEKEKRKFNK